MSRRGQTVKMVDPVVELSAQELATLAGAVHHYEKTMGIARHLTRVMPGQLRETYRFIQDEARVLEAFVTAQQEALRHDGAESREVTFTLLALVALWSRLLASLRTPRSRRRLRGGELQRRRHLVEKLGAVVATYARTYPRETQRELATRNVREIAWMGEYLKEQSAELTAEPA